MFEKGKSGNPAGRPKGIQAKRVEMRALLEPYAPSLIEKAVQLALEGDTTALKLCVDKIVPSIKPISESVLIEADKSLAVTGKSVVDAMTSGSISVTSGFDVLRSLQAQAKLEEMTIIEERLSALEKKAKL